MSSDTVDVDRKSIILEVLKDYGVAPNKKRIRQLMELSPLELESYYLGLRIAKCCQVPLLYPLWF